MNNQYVRFECGQEDRMTADLGPFYYAQFTYLSLEVATDEDNPTVLAVFDVARGDWWCAVDDAYYSDIVLWGEPEVKYVDKAENRGAKS